MDMYVFAFYCIIMVLYYILFNRHVCVCFLLYYNGIILCEALRSTFRLALYKYLFTSFTYFIEPCFGIGHNLSLICQMTSEDIKHQLIIIIIIMDGAGRG